MMLLNMERDQRKEKSLKDSTWSFLQEEHTSIHGTKKAMFTDTVTHGSYFSLIPFETVFKFINMH